MKQDNRLENDNLLSVFFANVKKSILFVIKNKVVLKRIFSFVFSVFVSLFELFLIWGLFFILRNGSFVFQKNLHHPYIFDFFKLQEIIYLSFLDYKPIWIYFIVAALVFVIVNSMYRFYKSKNWENWILTALNVGTCLLFCTLMLFHFFNLPSALILKDGKVIPLCYELSALHFEKEICSLCPQREFVFNRCVLRERQFFLLSILKK